MSPSIAAHSIPTLRHQTNQSIYHMMFILIHQLMHKTINYGMLTLINWVVCKIQKWTVLASTKQTFQAIRYSETNWAVVKVARMTIFRICFHINIRMEISVLIYITSQRNLSWHGLQKQMEKGQETKLLYWCVDMSIIYILQVQDLTQGASPWTGCV